MRRIQGINNDRGYVKLRIWLGPKRNPDGSCNKPHVKLFGPWSETNINRAKAYLDTTRENFKKGHLPKPDPEPISVPRACDLFFDRHFGNNPNRSNGSKRTARSNLNTMKVMWPIRALHSITALDVDQYLAQLKMLNSSKKNKLAFLRSMFNSFDAWVKRGEMNYMIPQFNPADYCLKMSNTVNKRERYATIEELRRTKAWCLDHDPEIWKYIMRAILSGLRKGDLDRAQGQNRVDVIPQKTSTTSGRRVVLPLNFSQPVQIKNFQIRWERVRAGAKLVDFHWHDWRHTSGTMLKQIGAADEVIQEVLGHADIEQTRAYINGKDERLKPWIDKLQTHLEAI